MSFLYSSVLNRRPSWLSHKGDAHKLDCRPRWLYAGGNTTKARKLLAMLHSRNGDIHSPLVDLEIEEIEEKITLDGADSMWTFTSYLNPININSERFWDIRPLFRTKSDRYRSGLVAMVGGYHNISPHNSRIMAIIQAYSVN